MEQILQKIEAFLFLSGEAVSKTELCRLLECEIDVLEKALEQLEKELAGHSLVVISTNDHVQLATTSEMSDFLKQYFKNETKDLSPAASETLALIAYRGPISRIDIDLIRGVDSRRMIRQLLIRGLIKKKKGKQEVNLYVITEDFLQYLGITSTNDLPRYNELSKDNKISDILRESKKQ